MRIRTVFSISLSMIVVGCAIRPLPRDVTRDTTFDISNKIRCETRDALIVQVKRVLDELHDGRSYVTPGNKLVRDIINVRGDGEDVFCHINNRVFDKNNTTLDTRTRLLLERFRGTSITYTFKYTISEQKTKSGKASFKMPFTRGSFSLGVAAGSDKTRQNLRTFKISDTFSSLLTGRNASGRLTGLRCEPIAEDEERIARPRKHWIYPITGNIGMSEVIKTYVDLENSSGTVDSFSDKLTFTTTFNAGADPSVTISGITGLKKFKFASATASYAAVRMDEHEVMVNFARPAVTTPKKHKIFFPMFESSKVEGMKKNTKIGMAIETKAHDKSAGDKDVDCSGSIFRISSDIERASIAKGLRDSREIASQNFLSDISDSVDR